MPKMEDTVKMLALAAINESKPVAIIYGEVRSISPLKIQVDQKLILTSAQLSLTDDVRDHDVEMTVNHLTENRSGGSGDDAFAPHNHAYTGRKTFTVHNALKVGDKVMMFRVQGGQKYIVWKKVVDA